MTAGDVAIAVLFLIGAGDVAQPVEIHEKISCDATVTRELAQPEASVVSNQPIGEHVQIRIKRPIFGRSSSVLYVCSDNQVRRQLIVSKLPNAADARDHWHRIRNALGAALGDPCLTANLEAIAASAPNSVEPEDAYWAEWRLGDTRTSVAIQHPVRGSTEWRVVVGSGGRNPSYRVAPDGTRSEIPEPECNSTLE